MRSLCGKIGWDFMKFKNLRFSLELREDTILFNLLIFDIPEKRNRFLDKKHINTHDKKYIHKTHGIWGCFGKLWTSVNDDDDLVA